MLSKSSPASVPAVARSRVDLLRELELLDLGSVAGRAAASSHADQIFAGLDRVARSAQRLFGALAASIAVFDGVRQIRLSLAGPDIIPVPTDVSLCLSAIERHEAVEVPDLRADTRFLPYAELADGRELRSYAAQPLVYRGVPVGLLGLYGLQPRTLDAEDRQALRDLGDLVLGLFETRSQAIAAREAAERLRDFATSSADWTWETDAEHRYTFVSERFEPITGLQREATLGRQPTDALLLDPLGRPLGDGRTLHRMLDTHEPFRSVIVAKAVRYGTRYVVRSAVPFLRDGRFGGYRGTARDISASIQERQEAQRKDMILRKVSDRVPGCLHQFRIGPDGRSSYPYASSGMRHVYGLGPEELREDAAAAMARVHPADAALVRASVQASARDLSVWRQQYRVRHPERGVIWVEGHSEPERTADGGTVWHGYLADITERKMAELALAQARERWSLAVRVAGIGLIEIDTDRDALELDAVAERLLASSDTLGEATGEDAVLPLQRPAFTSLPEPALRAIARVRASAEVVTVSFELPADSRHPAPRWIELVAGPVLDMDGEVGRVTGTVRDVTEQRHIETLEYDKRAAEESNRSKSEFLSRLSHELRTPLNGIIGFVQLLATSAESRLSEGDARRVANIDRAGRRLLSLVNDMLDVSRIEASRIDLKPVHFDVETSVAGAVALLEAQAMQAGIALRNDVAAGQYSVRADRRALEQVLMNLLSNAIKYNRRGGEVRVTAAFDGPGVVELHVIDNGIGMTSAQQARLFEPFNRLGAAGTRVEGTGLGLFISKKLTEAMEGALGVASSPGLGTCFTLQLPRGRMQGVDFERTVLGEIDLPGEADGAPAVRASRVLYVEDEELNRVLVDEALRLHGGFELVLAGDAVQGLAQMRQQPPDLLLLDLNLPGMSGVELLREIKRDPLLRDVSVIALSADAMPQQIRHVLDAGFDDYWTKPIDVRVFASRVLAFIEGRRVVAARRVASTAGTGKMPQ